MIKEVFGKKENNSELEEEKEEEQLDSRRKITRSKLRSCFGNYKVYR